MNTFKCASKINPAVNTIASWLNKSPSTSTSTGRPDAAVWVGGGKKSVTILPDNLGNGIGAGKERKM